MKTTKILISMIVMIFLAGISVQAKVVKYDFDDGTLQGWSNYEGVTEEFVVQIGGGNTPARSGNYVVVEANYGDRDSDTSVKILTSPVFWISATTSVEIWTTGGTGSVETPTWTNYSNLPDVAGNDFMGAGLRRMSDGEYLLFSRRSSSAEGSSGYQSIGWDAPTIAAAVAGDSDSQQYVVDIIDTFSGVWGWISFDDITLTDVAIVGDYPIALEPNPDKMATDVPRDVVLSWTPGEFTAAVNGHIVYLSESFNDVNDGIGDITQDANSYAPAQRLEFETTYYWRIDEVNAPPESTVYRGDVWSFTTEPFAYPIAGERITVTASSQASDNEGPEKTIDGSGMDENDLHSIVPDTMWISTGGDPGSAWIQYQFDKPYKLHEMFVWNYNGSTILSFYGLKDVTIEYSTDASSWTPLDNVPEFAQASGGDGYASDIVVPFDGAAAKYVRIIGNSNWGGGAGLFNQYGLSEVRFFSIPVFAREPSPDSGATDVGVDATLSWRAGREAASHNVYVGTDPDALTLAGPVTEPVFDVASLGLELGQTYHWRVDEVNDAELPDTWHGDPWSFTTSAFLVIENFDDYNTRDNQIWWSWKDGLGYVEHDGQPAYVGNGTGSAVGDETTATFMEMNIVQGGTQSMPVWYDNNKQGFAKYSETALTLPAGKRDWTTGSPVELSLWFRGEAANIVERLYVAVADTAVVYHEDPNAAQLTRWTEWVIPLETLAGQGVSLTNVDSIAVGMGTRGNATIPGGTGKMYFDEIRLHQDRNIMVPITVLDAGFDAHVLNNVGDYIDIADISYTGAWKSHSGDAWIDYGYYAADGDLTARSGNNKAYGYEDYIYQILDETFVEGAEYTLSVWVGQAWAGYDDSWSLYFTGEDYSDELISIAGNGPVGEWGQASLVYTATAADAGKKIGIKMQGAQYVTFEDVKLFQSAPAVTLQPDPEENLTVNPSFESPDLGPGGTEQWADYVDNWIINTQGSCYLEDGTWEIVAPDGVAILKMWNGAAIWQQIGNVSPNTDYEISMFIGRGYDTSAVQVELWAGGDPSALPTSYGIIGDTVGATLIGGASLTPTIAVGQSELMGLSLNTGAGFGPEDALWIRIESIGSGGTAAWVDNVMVTIP